jgi:hypothetical protein
VVNNTDKDYWPENTGIVSEKVNVECRIPMIDAIVHSGDKVQITIVFKVNEQKHYLVDATLDLDSDLNQYIEFNFSLFTPSNGRFGESLRIF